MRQEHPTYQFIVAGPGVPILAAITNRTDNTPALAITVHP